MQRIFLGWMLLSVAVYGCNGPGTGHEAGNDEGDEYAAVESSASAEKAIARVHTVEITGMKFAPDVLEVNKGDTIIWINKDIVDHDVTEQYSNSWTSGKMAPGSSWKMTVTRSDTYYCSIHVVMKGSVIVHPEDVELP